MDILLYPNGTVVPTTEYSSPSSFGMNSAFYHFWLAERGDLFDPVANTGIPYLLPDGARQHLCRRYSLSLHPTPPIRWAPVELKGERRLMTLLHPDRADFVTNQVETFDATPIPPGPGPNYPFLGAPSKGSGGDTR